MPVDGKKKKNVQIKFHNFALEVTVLTYILQVIFLYFM